MSAPGEVVSIYWNVNAQMQFLLARDGVVVRSFDPLLPELIHEGNALVEEDGLAFGDSAVNPRPLALELAARLTGVRVTREWLLERSRRTWTATGVSA